MSIALSYLLFVSFTDLVWSQKHLIVRWNSQILVPDSGHPNSLVYLDELVMRTDVGDPDPGGNGVLICRFAMPNNLVGWRKPNGDHISFDLNNDLFKQFIKTGSPTRVQLARTTTFSQNDHRNDGLWTCNGEGFRRHVPIYTRGRGAITIDSLTLGTTLFSSTSPRFSLIADTSGGPPTNFSWRYRNAKIITDSFHSIFLQANPNNDANGRMNSHYQSTLEVRIVAPGNYTYAVSNRATSGDLRTMTFLVEGGDPSNLQVVQTGMSTIELTWDPPPGPPSRGYRVTNSENSIAINVKSNNLRITNLSRGMYSFQVASLSRHFPNGIVGAETIAIRGSFTPNITLSEVTTTSVRVSWSSPPPLSFDVANYEVAVRRLTACSSVTQEKGSRHQNANDRTELFQGLGVYINYRAEVTVIFQSPPSFTVSSVLAEMEFTTLTIAPTEVPSNVAPITNSRTFSVSWGATDCGNQNGPNFRYDVDFQRMDGGAVPVGTVNNEMFTVEGLQPFTNYTFRVRGVNDAGNGNYTEFFIVQTYQEAPSEVPSNIIFNVTSRSISVSWNPINSSNHNGPNIRYQLEFMQVDSARPMVITVNDSQIIFNGLKPFTNYTFRVRGVNDFDNGNYTSLTKIQTNEDVPGILSIFENRFINSISLLVTWSPPLEPNGIITMYELTYLLNEIVMSENVSSDFNYVLLSEVNTSVTEIRIRAYSRVGPGPFTLTASNLYMPLTVTNVRVESLTATSVIVTWERVTEISSITEYIVYYAPVMRQDNEQSVRVPNTKSSVEISGLESTVEYQYQVTFIAVFGQTQIEGDRSENSRLQIARLMLIENDESVIILAGVIGGSALIVGIISVVLVLVWLWYLKIKTSKSSARLSSIIASQIGKMQDDVSNLYHYADYSQETLNDDSLTLSSIEEKQSGVYKLQATNLAGIIQQQVTLTMQSEIDTSSTVTITINTEPVPVDEFGDYVALNYSNGSQGFIDQFMALESGDDYAKSIGLSSKFKDLNWFANITNYDHNRIVLKPLQGHSEYTNDFINGCYIDGYSLPKKFIATQGPTLNTVVDFWRLIWQEKPPIIVNFQKNKRTKCEQYWPESESENFGPFMVTLTENQVFADYCIRTLKVTVEGSTYFHKIKQFHFTAWPNHGVLDCTTPMLAFHRRIASARNYHKGPMLVHCNAGVGCTGIFICIDNVLEQIEKEEVVDIVGTINKMRHQRMKMVENIDQYYFIYRAVMESMICGDTQISAAELRMKIAMFQNVDHSTGLNTFQSQFAVLEDVSPKLSNVVCNKATQHLTKNRSTYYLPPDQYRVILKEEQPDYIHASFVNGYKHQNAYIIAEGPMSSTTRNMLKLLCDRKCGVIVMLSALQENGKESCFQYWPAMGAMATHGEYTVELISEEALEGLTIRKISILTHKSQKAHQVTQFHITCWSPDGQCSNLRCVVDVINEMDKVQRETGNIMPILVHCSDTVTRSSMFCATATVIDRYMTEGVVDVFEVVKALRVQRPGAVPTVENYKTLFDATLTFLDSFDTNFRNA